jgi:hypothetical protein
MPDPMAILQVLAITAVVAALTALVFGLWRRAPVGGVLGAGAAFYLGCRLLKLWPHWPPREDQDRLLLLVLPAVLAVELAASFPRLRRWLAWLLRLTVAAAAAPVLLYQTTYLADLAGPGTREWTTAQAGLILGGLAVALAAVWAALALLLKRSPGRSVPLALSLVCVGAAATVMLSGYATAGQLALPLAAALAGAALARPGGAPGLLGFGIVGLFSVLVIGHFFGKLTTAHAALLGLAPLLVWLPELPYARALPLRLRGLVRMVVVVVPLALVLVEARAKFIEGSRPAASSGAKEPSLDDYMNFGK